MKQRDPMTGLVIRQAIHFSYLGPRRIYVGANALCAPTKTMYVTANWTKVSCKRCLKLRGQKW